MPSNPLRSRRGLTLLIAGLGVLAALVVAAAVPVPYVALFPGPTLNTLGAVHGQPLIQVTGRRSFPTDGNLNMVTVSSQGGPPPNGIDIFAALRAWLSPHNAVVPESEIFTPGQTQQEVVQEDTEQMVGSQQTAQAAAFCQLGIPFRVVDTVQAVLPGKPADGVLHKGDVIAAVDGTPVTCKHDAATLIKERKPGAAVALTINRGEHRQVVHLTTASVQGQAVVGIQVGETFAFPFPVKFSLGEKIGGPSAGMMFALGIIDKLTPGSLTGGKFIAGTGEIEADGAVDPIGGIQQKMVGARDAGATVFLAPAANCPDTAGAVPAGLRVIKVSTLNGALSDLAALRKGQPVPSC